MDSLVFITSDNSKTPNGRNARRHARAEQNRRTNPAKPQTGCFSAFQIGPTVPKRTRPGTHARKVHTASVKTTAKHDPLADSTLYHAARITVLSCRFEDVLAITAYHVRRATSQILATQPWCLIEVLRCRQWASTPFTLQKLNASEAVVSAYAFLVARLQHTVFDHTVGDLALADYSWALRSLQSALSHSRPKRQADLIPAAWLLTLSEMLDFPRSKVWHTHAAGTMALIKTELCDHQTPDKSSVARMMPSLLEAFLSSEAAITTNEPWQAIVHPIVAGCLDDDADLVDYVSSSLTTVLALMAESRVETAHGFIDLLAMMDRANNTRYNLKNIVIELVDFGLGDSDVLGLCLAALLGLDRLITKLRHEAFAHDLDSSYEEDDSRLCVQILQEELKRSEATPSTEIQLAFKRHALMLAAK